MSEYAWVDGDLVPRREARVSIDDFGFRYGLTCFETMLARHGRIFRFDAHLDRLEASLRLFRAPQPPRGDLARAVAATLQANRLDQASVRLTVTAGSGMRPALPATGTPAVMVTTDPLPPPPGPRRLIVSGVALDAGRPWRAAKVGQFAPFLLARVEAEEHGADDALLLNHAGHIAEASTSNVFLEVDGVIVTPPLRDGPLPGVTRAVVLELAVALGIEARERSVGLDDLGGAEAVFLTSSVAGVVPVVGVRWADASGVEREWARSPSAVVEALQGAYERAVEEETSRE